MQHTEVTFCSKRHLGGSQFELAIKFAQVAALGQKQTFALQNVMSALPPIADMCAATRDVRFVPIADMATGPCDGPEENAFAAQAGAALVPKERAPISLLQ